MSTNIQPNILVKCKWCKEEWYFSVVDVVNALDASTIPKRYWSDLKIKLKEEGFESYDKIVQLKLIAEDEKLRALNENLINGE